MEDVDFEEEEEEEEGNDEGWVLEPQEGVVGSMEGPDDSEVTFALHSAYISVYTECFVCPWHIIHAIIYI